jgi:hypothetical protein
LKGTISKFKLPTKLFFENSESKFKDFDFKFHVFLKIQRFGFEAILGLIHDWVSKTFTRLQSPTLIFFKILNIDGLLFANRKKYFFLNKLFKTQKSLVYYVIMVFESLKLTILIILIIF